MPTLAFSNTGNYWKTRYTFEPSCYSNQDANLISYAATGLGFLQFQGWIVEPQPETVDPNTGEIIPAVEGIPASAILPYIHNSPVGPPEYYGAPIGGSGIAIAFNEQVSHNKLYKSISLEGSSNLENSAFSLFTTNDTTVLADSTLAAVRPLNFKGGVVYADLGRGQENSQANIRAVASWAGTVSGPGIADNVVVIDAGAGASIQDGDDLFILNAQGQVFSNGFFVNPAQFNWNGGANFTANNLAEFGTVFFNGEMGIQNIFALPTANGPYTIISRGAVASYGKSVQGQYATLRIVFTDFNYELHAINAYYEPNTLDHGEKQTATSQLQKLLGGGKKSK